MVYISKISITSVLFPPPQPTAITKAPKLPDAITSMFFFFQFGLLDGEWDFQHEDYQELILDWYQNEVPLPQIHQWFKLILSLPLSSSP